MRTWIIAAFAVAAMAGTSLAEEESRIVGGEEAEPNSHPFMAAVTLEGLCCCGGTILDETHILTAAHCMLGYSYFEVILGAHNPFDPEETGQQRRFVPIDDVVVHEDYNSPGFLDNDIAIMKLSEPLLFNEYVQPISPAAAEEAVGGAVTAIGWGMVADSLPGNVDNLREVDLEVASDDVAEDFYPGTDFATKICTDASDGQGICQGDSGGPIVDGAGMQQGISSFVSSLGCEAGPPHCYTSVPHFVDWINANKN